MDEIDKLTDIEITRVWEVNCVECGVIDAPRDIEVARRSRREHFEQAHRHQQQRRDSAKFRATLR